MMRWLPWLLVIAPAWGQSVQEMVAQGEKVFNQTCATGYCHGLKGGSGGAPRLAARGFDEAYINATMTRGVSGTAMPAFATSLSRSDFVAVAAYVATLNGIATPNVNVGGGRAGGPPMEALPREAARGRALFFDSLRGFGRCATCHEVNGMGIPVASAIAKLPPDAAALRALATPGVRTATIGGESMPALVVSQGKTRTIFFDLTSLPPVQRTLDTGAASLAEGSRWSHASVLGAYSDSDLESILAYLRAEVMSNR
jgi:mono/diheme cytochrome c family protein